MKKEYKVSASHFKTYVGFGIMCVLLTILGYLLLDVIIMMIPVFGVFFTIIGFWSKDRVIITLHDDYLEAKEGIAAKKKLIKYKDITKAELHKSGKMITLFLALDEKEKKEVLNMNPIAKEGRTEIFELLNTKWKKETV